MTPGFAFVNESAGVTDAQVNAMAVAFATYWSRDLAPRWGLQPVDFIVASALALPAGYVGIQFTDTVAVADAIAFHSELDGVPTIVIQVPQCGGNVLVPQNGCSVSTAAAHELAEAANDPSCNLEIQMQSGPGKSIALEIADPFQDQSYPITNADGTVVYVSNFATPYWFDPQAPAGSPFDQMGSATAPFQIIDGYAVIYDTDGNPTEVFGDRMPNAKMRLGSQRRKRRLSPGARVIAGK